MTIPRSIAATTSYPSAVGTSDQDFLVIGGDNSGYIRIVNVRLG
jgi:hypothetical protein